MENTITNEITTVTAAANLMDTASDPSTSYCSFNASTPEGKALLFRAITNPDVRMKSMINKQIKIKDVFARAVTLTDDETGEVSDGTSVVFIDDLGVSYAAVSTGIFNATKNLLKVYGQPSTWAAPVVVMIKEVSVKKGSMLTFDVVG